MPLVLAEILFGQPALLGGIALASVPIVIHLLLRPRPRRTRFPAIVLLRRVVLTGQRSSRLRNLLLMLVRAAFLALLALLLAGPVRTDGRVDFVGADPLACAVVLDDSASMSYRVDASTTRLDLSREAAADFVHDSAGWPEGSELVALTSGISDEVAPELGHDRAAMLERLHTAGSRDSARPLGAALAAAGQVLRTARQPVRRLVLYTDGAASAWRDVSPAALAGIENLAVRVVTSGGDPQSNLALTAVEGPQRLQPATARIPVQAAIAAEGVDTECWLTVRAGGQELRRVGPVDAQPGALRQVTFDLPPLPAGPHLLTVELEPADRMDFDQRRYLAVQTADPPAVWLVGAGAVAAGRAGAPAGAAGDDDLSAVIFRNLLAPEVLKPEQQRVRLLRLSAEQLASGAQPTRTAAAYDATNMPAAGESADRGSESRATDNQAPVLAVVLSNAELSREAQALLLRQIERGMTVVLAPASAGGAGDWPGLRELVCDDPPADEELSEPTSLTWVPTSEFADHPELIELSRCGVRRRLRIAELRPEAVVHARYADDRPAVVSRRRGSGRVILLTTSPDPEWSDLGIRAAGLISWLHLLVDEALGPPDAIASFGLGEQARTSFAAIPASGLIRVACDSTDDVEPNWTRLKDHAPQQFWPTDHVGGYKLETAAASQLAAAYTVNWPTEESVLAPITATQVQRALGVADVRLESADGDATARPGSLARLFAIRDLRKALAVLLLAVFVGELVLSGRRAAAST
jgi:hypothetical protein